MQRHTHLLRIYLWMLNRTQGAYLLPCLEPGCSRRLNQSRFTLLSCTHLLQPGWRVAKNIYVAKTIKACENVTHSPVTYPLDHDTYTRVDRKEKQYSLFSDCLFFYYIISICTRFLSYFFSPYTILSCLPWWKKVDA